jgi:hypothetical protein
MTNPDLEPAPPHDATEAPGPGSEPAGEVDAPGLEPDALSAGERLRLAAQSFHLAVNGIRELLELVSPHLDEAEPLVTSSLAELTRRQRKSALIWFISFATAVDSSHADAEVDPFADDEDEDEDDGDDLATADEDPDPDLRLLLERARVGTLSDDEVQSLIETEFAGAEWRFRKVQKELHGFMLSPSKRLILNSSMLVTAVAVFESLIASILSIQLHEFPALVEAAEPRFSLADLKEFASIHDAADAAISAKVDTLMSEGYSGWETWFQKKAGTALSELSIDRLRVVEAIQRRHLLVHTSGRVSRQYLQRLGLDGPAVGTKLQVTPGYLERALDELDVLGCALAVTLAYEWASNESADALRDLNVLAYELLQARRFAAAQKLCAVGCALDSGEGWVGRALHVNEWIAKKHLFGAEAIRAQVESWDVSALAPEFCIAKFALLNDHDSALALLPKLIEDGVIANEALAEWPLLSDLREDERFAALVLSLSDDEPGAVDSEPGGGPADVASGASVNESVVLAQPTSPEDLAAAANEALSQPTKTDS